MDNNPLNKNKCKDIMKILYVDRFNKIPKLFFRTFNKLLTQFILLIIKSIKIRS